MNKQVVDNYEFKQVIHWWSDEKWHIDKWWDCPKFVNKEWWKISLKLLYWITIFNKRVKFLLSSVEKNWETFIYPSDLSYSDVYNGSSALAPEWYWFKEEFNDWFYLETDLWRFFDVKTKVELSWPADVYEDELEDWLFKYFKREFFNFFKKAKHRNFFERLSKQERDFHLLGKEALINRFEGNNFWLDRSWVFKEEILEKWKKDILSSELTQSLWIFYIDQNKWKNIWEWYEKANEIFLKRKDELKNVWCKILDWWIEASSDWIEDWNTIKRKDNKFFTADKEKMKIDEWKDWSEWLILTPFNEEWKMLLQFKIEWWKLQLTTAMQASKSNQDLHYWWKIWEILSEWEENIFRQRQLDNFFEHKHNNLNLLKVKWEDLIKKFDNNENFVWMNLDEVSKFVKENQFTISTHLAETLWHVYLNDILEK